jgi:hypothetical protein
MANWLERAKREISKDPNRSIAKTAKTQVSSVLAVPHPGKSENSGRSFVGFDGSQSAPLPEIESANDGALPKPTAEARRQEVLAMLAQEPGLTYAMLTDDEAEPDAVILALAIREGNM